MSAMRAPEISKTVLLTPGPHLGSFLFTFWRVILGPGSSQGMLENSAENGHEKGTLNAGPGRPREVRPGLRGAGGTPGRRV